LRTVAGGAVAAILPRRSRGADEAHMDGRPNILWISVEDMSPDLGCYGDKYAVTPNLDRLAAEGVRYRNVFTHSPVCAPSRSGIITGMYPTTIGTHQMRCQGVPPPEVKCFPEYLRAAGYYCTNNVKTDYQFASPLTAWDENSSKADWRGRRDGQPFFSVINLTTTHESQVRSREKRLLERIASLEPHERHDPAKAVIPPYYPDTPAVRRDWAQYYDIMTLMDKEVAEILMRLADDALADETIVWFWADHGRGLPRAKRWIYDSGLHVPLIVRVPEKFRRLAMPGNPDALKPGTVSDDLIAFVDFAPTMLSLAGIKVPDCMQGRPFLGSQRGIPRKYIFAARDRMDEAYDIIRGVRDKRYKYIRNYMPHVTYGQDIDYMNEMPTMQEMRRLNAEGKLVGPQKHYFRETKPIEELYDTQNDPYEVRNLAENPEYRDVLDQMRKVDLRWMKEAGDIGLIPEPEFDEMKRPGGEWEKTEAAVFLSSLDRASGKAEVTITCATPGASIAYKVGNENKAGWRLYTRPLRSNGGQVIRAKACRLGFHDSEEVQFKVVESEAAIQQIAPLKESRPHWREEVDKTDLLERLRAIKALDRRGAGAIPWYLGALTDPYASVRYWGVVGLHNVCRGAETAQRAKTAVAELLRDGSPIVRIAAAQAMCDWGEEKEGLAVLTKALTHESDTVRLNAAIAFGRIGEKARPALPQLRAAMRDTYGSVPNVLKYVLRRLETQTEEARTE